MVRFRGLFSGGVVLGYHVWAGGCLLALLTTIVMSSISINSVWINYDELLHAVFLLLDVLLAKIIQEIHDTNHSLRVSTLSFRGSQYTRLIA